MTPRRPYHHSVPHQAQRKRKRRSRPPVAPRPDRVTVRVPTFEHDPTLECSLNVFSLGLLVQVAAGDGADMTQPPPQAPRRRLSWSRGHKLLTAGIAALGLL